MSTQDPEELVVCPYDPVHRVAAKKLPYHISKCRKQYDTNKEYKTCPFNARHVIPTPEFHYHMETCDSKAAIDMEIAFEQNKNEVSHTIKGCTNIPPPPTWEMPKETENWDDEDEDAPPVLHPQPIRFQPPANLPRPTASRPVSRFDASSSPMSRKHSPNRFPSRASRGRQLPSYGFADEHDNVRSTSSSRNQEMSQAPSPSPQALPRQQTISSPLQPNNQADSAALQPPNSYFSPQSSNEHLSQSSQPLDPTDPLLSYNLQQHNPSQTQVPTQLYPPQPQPIQYLNPPMSVPLPPQSSQSYFAPNLPSYPYAYNTQIPQLHYMPPTNPAQPPYNYYLPQQPIPPQHFYQPIQSYDSNPYQYPPSVAVSQGLTGGTNHGIPAYAPSTNLPYTQPISTPVLQGNMHPSGVSPQYEQSSVVTSGGGSSPGRGRGRGLPRNSSPPVHSVQPVHSIPPVHTVPQTQNAYQVQTNAPQYYPCVSQQAFYPPQMNQQLFQPLQVNNALLPNQSAVHVPTSQPPYQANQEKTQFSQQPNNPNPRHSISQSSVAAQSSPPNIPLPKPGGVPMATKLNRVKVSLATIALIEHKRDSGTPLSREEVELLETKNGLLEQLK